MRAYEAAGLRDYGRIDVRLAHDDAIYIVEANPNPYLADGEDLAWAAEEGGYLYPDFIEKIAEMAHHPRRLAQLIALPDFLAAVYDPRLRLRAAWLRSRRLDLPRRRLLVGRFAELDHCTTSGSTPSGTPPGAPRSRRSFCRPA